MDIKTITAAILTTQGLGVAVSASNTFSAIVQCCNHLLCLRGSYSGGSRICEKGGPGIQMSRCRARPEKVAQRGEGGGACTVRLPDRPPGWEKNRQKGGPRPIRPPPPGSATVLCCSIPEVYDTSGFFIIFQIECQSAFEDSNN